MTMTNLNWTTQVTDFVVDSDENFYHLFSKQMMEVQQARGARVLEPGIYVLRIREFLLDDATWDDQKVAPLVMLWLYDGVFKKLKTNKLVLAGWVVLNGYDDTITLGVLEACKLCSFFLNTKFNGQEEQVTISVIKVGEPNDLHSPNWTCQA
ncbi:MAG: hypothetical protein ACRC8A_08640 [Microcoleaceae cyanobacterium]